MHTTHTAGGTSIHISPSGAGRVSGQIGSDGRAPLSLSLSSPHTHHPQMPPNAPPSLPPNPSPLGWHLLPLL